MRNLYILRARFMMSMKIYFRYPVNVAMTMFEPIMWIAPFYFMGKAFSQGGSTPGFENYTGNSDYIGFIVIGYMITIFVSTVFWNMGFSLREEMQQGVLESNWSAPANRVVLLVGRSIFQFCAAIFECILTGIVCYFAFGFKINNNILKELIFLLPGIAAMLGFGLAVSALVLLAKDANSIIDITSGLVSGMSGGFFPVKVLPKGALFISLSIPITYIYDSSRALLINQTPIFPLRTELYIIIISSAIFWIFGSFVFLKIEKRCRELGNLGVH